MDPTAPRNVAVNSSALSFLYSPALTSVHDYWKKTIALTKWTFVWQSDVSDFNTLFGFLIAFLPRSKCVLIS